MKKKGKTIKNPSKCCKCPSKKKIKKKTITHNKKPSKRKTANKRKTAKYKNYLSKSNRLAAAPNIYSDKDVRSQIELVLELLDQDNSDVLKGVFKDRVSPFHSIKMDIPKWNKLTYWNAHQMIDSMGGGNRDDMRTIVYMIKHDVIKYKQENRATWTNNILKGIFSEEFMRAFKDRTYGGPVIKGGDYKRISIKDITIILLKHRIEMLDWMDKSKQLLNARAAEESSRAKAVESTKAAEENSRAAEESSVNTPDNWDDINTENENVDTTKTDKVKEDIDFD